MKHKKISTEEIHFVMKITSVTLVKVIVTEITTVNQASCVVLVGLIILRMTNAMTLNQVL